ncbi:MAG: glycosyltransferase family 9 protein, partial [Alphaproteobacteria bacterium]
AGFALSGVRPPAGYRKPATMIRQILDLLEMASGTKVEETRVEMHDAASGAAAAWLLPDGIAHVGLVPGSSAGRANKRWPLDRYVELARRQASRGRVPVFILGPEETDWRTGLARDVPQARFPLQEFAASGQRPGPLLTIALASRMRAAVSNDSGGGHLVAAGGVPLVSLWGPSVMEKAPPQTRRLVTILARDYGTTAMEAIPVDRVDDALEDLLASEA